jgi:hypothetical protein
MTDTIMAAPRPVAPQPRAVPARSLLQESELAWSADVLAALRQALAPADRHRRTLVLKALAAYERLRMEQAPTSDELTVFRRWPACTVVAITEIAAAGREALRQGLLEADPVVPESHWLHGWSTCWSELVGQDGGDLPGVRVLRAASMPVDHVSVPRLMLDPQRGALIVTLPAPAAAGASVSAGGSPCVSQSNGWLIPRPTPVVTCEDARGEIHRLRVVDVADPLLLFSGTGEMLPADRPLSPGEVWMIHLGEPAPGWAEGGARVAERRSPPVGWSRWRLYRILLTNGSAIRSAVDHGTGPRFGAWRRVSAAPSAGAAEIRYDMPLSGVTGPDGEPVYPAPPTLELTGGPDTAWDVHIGPVGEPGTHTINAEGGESVELRYPQPGPMLGRYRVRAAGGGAPLVTEFTVAEGLDVSSRVQFRLLSPRGGLRPADASVSTPRGVRPTPSSIHFGPYHRDRQLDLHGPDGRSLRLRVEIPHCAVRLRFADRTEDWSIDRRTVAVDDLVGGCHLDLRLPTELRDALDTAPPLVVETDAGPAIQEIRGHRVAGTEVQRYRLDRLVDTVREAGTVRLRLALPGQDVVVATVRGNVPASDVVCVGSLLRLRDRGVGQLRIHIYARWAPWLAPQSTLLEDGTAKVELAPPFDSGTPLAVLVLPAGGPPPPAWPMAGDLPRGVALFDIPGTSRCGLPLASPAARAVSSYLAGGTPLPEGSDHLHLLWHVAARAPAVLGSERGDRTAQECAAYLGTVPFAALQAVARARVRNDETVVPLIRSGLAARDLRRVPDPDATRLVWRTAPLAALLATSPLLAYLTGTPEFDLAELDDAERRLLDEVTARCADPALAVLSGAAVDHTLRAIDALADGQLPPAATASDAGEDLGAAREFVRRAGLERFADADPSLVCALVARLAAQGDCAAAAVEQQIRATWVRVAHAAPRLAGNDIVLAEFLVTRLAATATATRSTS